MDAQQNVGFQVKHMVMDIHISGFSKGQESSKTKRKKSKLVSMNSRGTHPSSTYTNWLCDTSFEIHDLLLNFLCINCPCS